MSKTVNSPESSVAEMKSATSSGAALGTASGSDPGSRSPLGDQHRRLARYLYAADLVAGKRVLDIECGPGHGSALLADKGAAAVLGLQLGPAGAGGPALPAQVTLRALDKPALLAEGGLAKAAGPRQFDVVFLPGDGALLRAPRFLAELRRLLVPSGHLIVGARSKEAFPDDPQALGYFELLDSLEQAGFGPVTMCGQSPFIAAAVVPFGVAEPPLVLDDSLAPAEAADEYLALCGPAGAPRPYEVVRLPRGAVAATPQVVERVVEKVVEKVIQLAPQRVVEKVEVKVPDPQVVADRERLAGEVEKLRSDRERLSSELAQLRGDRERLSSEASELRSERDTLKSRLHEVAGHEQRLVVQRREAEAQKQELGRQLQVSEAARERAAAMEAELAEQLRQRHIREAEHAEAALTHERQMRELRTALEEREAFVAELEEQARELPRMQEELQVTQQRAEQAGQAERLARQRLAEVEGHLLRARGELQQRAAEAGLAAELENKRREIEAMRTEILVQRAELEQREQGLTAQRSELEQQLQTAAGKRLELERTHAEREAEREAAVAKAERERATAEQQLVSARAEAAQLKQSLTSLERELQALHRQPVADGVPMPVGDIPTAPVARVAGAAPVSAGEELTQLRAQIAELQADNERLKDKFNQAERETWKYMKARSEAEQAAAEVREDTVRKLRDARKLASVELTRAMEEATKKAVQLREELTRTEAERKEALGQIKELRAARDAAAQQVSQLKAELDALRWAAPLPEGGQAPSELALHDEVTRIKEEGAAALRSARSEAERALGEERSARQAAQAAADEALSRVAELRAAVVGMEQVLGEARLQAEREQKRVEAIEEELRQAGDAQPGRAVAAELSQLQQELQSRERAAADLRAERDALGRLLAEVEREAFARAERARQLRARLAERERETEALRLEIADRDRRIGALESKTPPSEELTRLQGELQAARRRIADLQLESARHDQHGDEAVATALRERARSGRLGEQASQTTRERDEAMSRAGELEQRLTEAMAESVRLRTELARLGGVDAAPAETSPASPPPPPAPPAAATEESHRPPPLNSSTVQRVLQVGQSLGLEPVYMPNDDGESKK